MAISVANLGKCRIFICNGNTIHNQKSNSFKSSTCMATLKTAILFISRFGQLPCSHFHGWMANEWWIRNITCRSSVHTRLNVETDLGAESILCGYYFDHRSKSKLILPTEIYWTLINILCLTFLLLYSGRSWYIIWCQNFWGPRCWIIQWGYFARLYNPYIEGTSFFLLQSLSHFWGQSNI